METSNCSEEIDDFTKLKDSWRQLKSKEGHVEKRSLEDLEIPRPHTKNDTKQLLDSFGWNTLNHLPNFFDSAPSDYHLFISLDVFIEPRSEEMEVEVEKWLN